MELSFRRSILILIKFMKLILALFFLFFPFFALCQISGKVQDAETGEWLSGVRIYVNNQKSTVQSNSYGFFSINAKLSDTLNFYSVGYKRLQYVLDAKDFKTKDIVNIYKLPQEEIKLDEVTVLANRQELFNKSEMSKLSLSLADIKSIPMILGEKDPIKALQFLPGIQEISEGSASLSVRGGSADQNLMILDDATVYNANHLFGFFSTFNADPIIKIDAYKGAYPAQYGGRLSSIIDVKMREGNKKEFSVEGGIGLISSRLLLEGPLKTDKASFLIAARRTYADQLILPFQSEREKTAYHFGDINIKLNTTLNSKNTLHLSSYAGKDRFYQKNKIPRRESFLLNDVNLDWSNITLTTRWNKIYNDRLFHNASLVYSQYDMNFGESTDQDYLDPSRFESLSLNSGIRDFSSKIDYEYFLSNAVQIKWGGILTQHYFRPREFSYESSRGLDPIVNNSIRSSNLEGAVYGNISGDFSKIFYKLGARISYFENLNKPQLEPRFVIGYNVIHSQSLSISYARMNQFLHLISNTGNGLPTDVLIPSTVNLPRGRSDIIGFSYTHHFNSTWNFVFDSYYKWIKGNIAYRNGASFLGIGTGAGNEPFEWEDNLVQGQSWNYGYEFLIQKSKGRFTGFAGYTLAWSISQFDELNDGKPFYNNQDRRHILETSLVYQLRDRMKLSTNFIFASGNALTVADGVFFTKDKFSDYLELYSGFNRFRAENTHRLDLGLNLKSKKNNSSWDFSIYNVYFRKNPYQYTSREVLNSVDRTKTVFIARQWLLPIIPSVTYNFKLR